MSPTILYNMGSKSKSFLRRVLLGRELFPALVVIVVGIASFGLGRLSVKPEHTRPTGQRASSVNEMHVKGRAGSLQSAVATSVAGKEVEEQGEMGASSQQQALSASGRYVASKNSTKYHLPWCSGAARIAEANKVWFSSKEEAAAAGYTPAANCKGI